MRNACKRWNLALVFRLVEHQDRLKITRDEKVGIEKSVEENASVINLWLKRNRGSGKPNNDNELVARDSGKGSPLFRATGIFDLT